MILSTLFDQFSNSWFLGFAMIVALFVARERQHRKEMFQFLEDRQKAFDQWQNLFDQAQAAHAEQLKILQEAKNVVWVKMEAGARQSDKPDGSKTH